MHVHAEHSALGDATMTETFGFAFKPLSESGGGPRLHHALRLRRADRLGRDRPPPARVSGQADRAQRGGDHLSRPHEQPHQRAATSTTARARSSSSSTTGRWSRDARPRPPRELFADVHAAGGFTQINHPTIFPSTDPFFQQFCRGCPWDYTDAETDYSSVDAIEVNTGPAAAAEPVCVERDRLLRAGARHRREDRSGRGERLPQRRPHGRVPQPAGPGRHPDHHGVRGRAVGGRDPPGSAGVATPT